VQVPPGTSGSPKRVYGRPGNSDAFRAMKNNGIKYVVGDNSRPGMWTPCIATICLCNVVATSAKPSEHFGHSAFCQDVLPY
jgi:hypothetical protein